MLYQKFKVSAVLIPFVETFYVWECSARHDTPFIVESPPNGYASMVFNYGEAYGIVNEKYQDRTVPSSFMSGQATKRYQLHLKGTLGMIGIVFKPAALNTIFGLPMYEFSDERIDLNDVLGREAIFLHERILEAQSAIERVDILDQYLTRKVLHNKKGFDRTDYVANMILEKRGILPIQDLMKELYVCPRQFQRQFLNKVGVSAKYYARISRMSSLCAQLAQSKWRIQDWHQLIYNFGYYDQSHFIKEFSEFMGKAPSSYVKHNIELANYLKNS